MERFFKETDKKTALFALAGLFLTVLMLSGCAGPHTAPPRADTQAVHQETLEQKRLIYQRALQDNARVTAVAFPLLAANAEFCGRNLRPMDGMSGWTLDGFPRSEQPMVHQLFGLTNAVTLSNVVPGSPAAQAGLRAGDILVSINGTRVGQGQRGLRDASNLLQQTGMRPRQIHFSRGGQIRNTVVTPVQGCAYPVGIDQNDFRINAYADGQRIVITRGMLRFVENDTELALVVAHELAHNAMGHVPKKMTNALAGALGGLAVDLLLGSAGVHTGNQASQLGGQMGAMSHSVAFEQEADYVGMYFMARAGFETGNVATFWRRMAVEQGDAAVEIRRTHPTSPERFVAINATHQEIQAKKRAGQPLAPNLRR